MRGPPSAHGCGCRRPGRPGRPDGAPSASFSLVASAWTSTMIACAVPPSACRASSASRARNGSSASAMNRRPSTCRTSDALAARGADLGDAAARRARRQIERADDPRLAVDVADQLALVPDMVAHGEDVGTGVEELGGDRGRQPVAAGGVLGVDDDRIQRQRRPAAWAARPGARHGRSGRPRRRRTGCAWAQLSVAAMDRQPASVTTRSSGTSVASAGTRSTSWPAKQYPARTGRPPAAAIAAKVMS